MFEDLEVANKEYEDLKIKYDELVVAKNGADEKIKTYEEGNKNYENEIQRLKIKNYEYFEQLSSQNNSDGSSNSNNKNNEENQPTINDILKMF